MIQPEINHATKQSIETFELLKQDRGKIQVLVDNIEQEIAQLNERRYILEHNKRKIIDSLKEGAIYFKPDDAELIFKETGILFSGQIKKDFEQLIAFNKSITEERNGYLIEEKRDIEAEIEEINLRLDTLGKHRAETLALLRVLLLNNVEPMPQLQVLRID